MRELLFSQPREKTNILVETRIAFLGRELLLGKSTKNSLNLWQTRITQRNVILVGIVWESLILVWFLDENYIKPRRELSFSLLENDNSRLNIVILPLIRGENHVIRGTITVSIPPTPPSNITSLYWFLPLLLWEYYCFCFNVSSGDMKLFFICPFTNFLWNFQFSK